MPYLEGLLHCVIQIEYGLSSTVDAFRLQEVVKPLVPLGTLHDYFNEQMECELRHVLV